MLAAFLCAAVPAAADPGQPGSVAPLVNPDPNAPRAEPAFKPFSNFGSDIPGYRDPKVGGAPAGQADPHPFHPFRDFGKSIGDPWTNKPRQVVPLTPPSDPGPLQITEPGRKEDADGGADAADPAVDEYGKPIDVEREDAQANFHTVVEAFVARNSVDGCWPLKDAGRALCLRYLSTDTQRLKKDGKGAYRGVVVLRDAERKIDRAMTFKIDFSGDEWSVVWVRLLGAKRAAYVRGGRPEPSPAPVPPALPAFRPGASQ